MMSLSANLKQKQLLCGFIPSKSFLQVSLCHIVYHYPRALPLLCPPGRGVVIILSTTDWTDSCPMAIKQIKKFVAFPRLTPLQPDAHAHPCKQASLVDSPHPSGLPTGRRKAPKQNSCPWQYKISLRRRLLTITSDL